MGQLEDMTMFVRIVEAGGIGKAAEQVNLAKSAVSRRLVELEQRLKTQLMIRTTRKFHLTEAGIHYYQQSLKIIADVAELNANTSSVDAELEGTLRLALPLSFGIEHLSEAISEFSQQHPKLTIQTDLADRKVNLIEEGFDLAIRIGELADSSLQAKRLTPIRFCLCASPAYLSQYGTPTDLAQLAEHQFLQYGYNRRHQIEATDSQGVKQHVALTSQIKSNNGDFLNQMAIKGLGICLSPTFICWQAINQGQLQRLLTDYILPTTFAYAVYPQNRFLSHRARTFIDFLSERFGDSPYWDEPPITATQIEGVK